MCVRSGTSFLTSLFDSPVQPADIKMLKLPVRACLLAFSILANFSAAHLVSYHFPGYGFSWYDPLCGFACTNAISSAPLPCSSSTGSNSPQCLASSAPFLTSLAYCMNSRCDPANVPIWKREKFWANDMTGGDATVVPILDYQAALQSVTKAPIVEFNSSSKSILNETVLVPRASYTKQIQFMAKFDHLEHLQATYMYVIAVSPFKLDL